MAFQEYKENIQYLRIMFINFYKFLIVLMTICSNLIICFYLKGQSNE